MSNTVKYVVGAAALAVAGCRSSGGRLYAVVRREQRGAGGAPDFHAGSG